MLNKQTLISQQQAANKGQQCLNTHTQRERERERESEREREKEKKKNGGRERVIVNFRQLSLRSRAKKERKKNIRSACHTNK